MKQYKCLFCFLLGFLFLLPLNVFAVDCTYKTVGDSLSGSQAGTLKCEMGYSNAFLFGGLTYSCKYTVGSNTYTALFNDAKGKNSGFNLETHIKDKGTCPKFVVINTKNPGGYSLYAANTQKQVDKIIKYDGKAEGSWQPVTESGHLNDEDVKEKNCGNYKKDLDDRQAALAGIEKKLRDKKCDTYKLSDDERETVASAENLKLARECDTLLLSLKGNATTNLKELENYATRECLEKGGTEYNSYKSSFESYQNIAAEMQANLDEQLTKPDDSDKEKEDDKTDASVDISDFNQKQTCEGVFGVTEDGVFQEESLGWLIQKLLNYTKIAGPILVILFSMFEFAKAIVSSDDDAMKKAQSRLVIRLIAVVALFLLPFIVGEALKLINGISNPTCYFK